MGLGKGPWERSTIDVKAARWEEQGRDGDRIAVLIDGGGVQERCQMSTRRLHYGRSRHITAINTALL